MNQAPRLALTVDDVLAARDRIAGQILVTPFLEARVLSQNSGTRGGLHPSTL
jgi:threonine dehydratase